MKYEKLFTPIKIGNVEIKNRIAMAPMLMDFGQFDGRTTEMLMDYYEERAKGGTGLIITEITRVNDRTGGAAFAQLGMSLSKACDAQAVYAENYKSMEETTRTLLGASLTLQQTLETTMAQQQALAKELKAQHDKIEETCDAINNEISSQLYTFGVMKEV